MKKIILVVIASFLLSGCNRQDQHQPFTNSALVLTSGGFVSQSITARANNLNIVSICLRNPNHVTMPLTFKLIENDQVIRTLDFSSANIDKDDCTKLKFVPVDNSENRTYIAKIESLTTESDSTILPSIVVEKNDSVLHYKTFYYQSTREVIIESITQFYNRLPLDPWFLIFWLGLIIFTVFKITRRKSEF